MNLHRSIYCMLLPRLLSNLDNGCLGFHGALGPQGLLDYSSGYGQQGALQTNPNLR